MYRRLFKGGLSRNSKAKSYSFKKWRKDDDEIFFLLLLFILRVSDLRIVTWTVSIKDIRKVCKVDCVCSRDITERILTILHQTLTYNFFTPKYSFSHCVYKHIRHKCRIRRKTKFTYKYIETHDSYVQSGKLFIRDKYVSSKNLNWVETIESPCIRFKNFSFWELIRFSFRFRSFEFFVLFLMCSTCQYLNLIVWKR